MKNLLIAILTLSVLFVSGCSNSDTKEKEPKDNKTKTEAPVDKKKDVEASKEAAPAPETAPAPEAAPAPDIAPEDIKKPEEIQSGNNLEALINEFNDPNTTPERREELRLLLGDFFSMFEGETITIPTEQKAE